MPPQPMGASLGELAMSLLSFLATAVVGQICGP